jgi:hypothetical protein
LSKSSKSEGYYSPEHTTQENPYDGIHYFSEALPESRFGYSLGGQIHTFSTLEAAVTECKSHTTKIKLKGESRNHKRSNSTINTAVA